MKHILFFSTILLLMNLSFTSCQKENIEQNVSPATQLLISKTWQVEEVKSSYGGTTDIPYKRGAANNSDDFSLIRQTYKKDGSITYIGQFGERGSNGKFELLANDTKMRLSLSSGISTLVEQVTISANAFSYRLVNTDGYTQFTFSPVQ